MTIKELLPDNQYDGIVFFLNEHGYTSPLDLSGFDYDELYFVPGVSDTAVEKCRDILTAYINLQKLEEESASQEKKLGIDEKPNPQNKSEENAEDNNLSAVFSNLTALITAAVEAAESRERLDLFRAAFLKSPDCCERYEYNLFSSLCDEIGAFLPASDEKAEDEKRYSPEEYELLAAVSIEEVFADVPRGKAMICFCRENNITTLADLGKINFSEIKAKGLGQSSLRNCKEAYITKRDAVLSGETVSIDAVKTPRSWFVESFSLLKERDRYCFLSRAQGQTLQEIGNTLGITRERVRQIVAKVVRTLKSACESLFVELASERLSVCSHDIKAKIEEQDHVDAISYVLKNIESVSYFPFADKFVASENIPQDWYIRLQKIADDVIGDSINYYDNLELIDEQLSSQGLAVFDSIDYIGYLLEHGYKALGDYLVKKSQAYRNACLYVICHNFQDGIKLDNDENNTDILRLRTIVHKEFGDAGLPDNNRALTARVAPALILCGRGKYISPENVMIDIPLLEQIVDFINTSDESSIYYSGLFNAFSGRLLAQTAIDNPNYLHGVLRFFYPDEYNYERDFLVKKGMEHIPFEVRLAQIITESKRAMSKAEIQGKMLGITDIQIVNAQLRSPELIQWDYNMFNHMDNISVTDDEITQLGILLQSLTDSQLGYCSENTLFSSVANEMPEFIRKNSINNCHNLFYVVSYLFRDRYRFARPHIASTRFPQIELTNTNVARFFIRREKTLSYPDLVKMSQRAGWANATFSMVINAVEEDYCRISLNEYIRKSDFRISEEDLSIIKDVLSDLLASSGYYGIFAIYNYEPFPPLDFDWNEFLLQTVLEKYDLGFKILEPNLKDRRYKRGIIVPATCSCNSYEEFVIEQLKADHIQAMPEDEFSSYLRRKGLVLTATIPQELYDGDGVRLENGLFVYE